MVVILIKLAYNYVSILCCVDRVIKKQGKVNALNEEIFSE